MSRSRSPPRAVCRKIDEKWSRATSDGRKWFESQRYVTGRGNTFKSLKEGDLIFFGPSRASGRLDGVARVGGLPVRGLIPEEAAGALEPLMSSSPDLRPDLREYLSAGKSVDYIPFDVVWDVRALSLTFQEGLISLGSCVPGSWQGVPQAKPPPDPYLLQEFLRKDGVVERRRASMGSEAP